MLCRNEAAEVPEAPDASEMPKRTHRRSHFIPSSAAAAAAEVCWLRWNQ